MITWSKASIPPEHSNSILIAVGSRMFQNDDWVVKGWYNHEQKRFYSAEMHEDEILEPLMWRDLPEYPRKQLLEQS